MTGHSNTIRPLIIRADANDQIGSGHVMRTLALAQAWQQEGGRAIYLTASDSVIGTRLAKEGCQVVEIESQPGSCQDADQLRTLANQLRAFVLIDGYHFGENYLASLNGCFPLAIMDDYAHLNWYECNLLINQNPKVDASIYSGKVAGEILWGTDYALLRSEFLRHQQILSPQPESATRVLVTMGGADPTNSTEPIVTTLQELRNELEIRIILGSANKYQNQLVKRIGDDPRFVLKTDVQDMSEDYRWADLAICAGGSSNWELCYFGVPRIIFVLAENQSAIANALQSQGAAINLGMASDFCPRSFQTAFLELAKDQLVRERMRTASQQMIDGNGVIRVIEACREVANNGNPDCQLGSVNYRARAI